MDDLTFRKKKKIRVTGTLTTPFFYLLPPKKKGERSIMRLHTSCKPHKNTRYLLTFTLNAL